MIMIMMIIIIIIIIIILLLLLLLLPAVRGPRGALRERPGRTTVMIL